MVFLRVRLSASAIPLFRFLLHFFRSILQISILCLIIVTFLIWSNQNLITSVKDRILLHVPDDCILANECKKNSKKNRN